MILRNRLLVFLGIVIQRLLGRGGSKGVSDEQDGFSAGLVESPVCCLESCVLDTVSYREGNRRQLRLWRMSTDINVVLSRSSLNGFYGRNDGFGGSVNNFEDALGAWNHTKVLMTDSLGECLEIDVKLGSGIVCMFVE